MINCHKNLLFFALKEIHCLNQNMAHFKAFSVCATLMWIVFLLLMSGFVIGERILKDKNPERFVEEEKGNGFFVRVIHFLWQDGKSSYQHVWPVSISEVPFFSSFLSFTTNNVSHFCHHIKKKMC